MEYHSFQHVFKEKVIVFICHDTAVIYNKFHIGNKRGFNTPFLLSIMYFSSAL
jgi:hypothetical protein